MSVKIDPEGPRRSKKDPVRLRKLRQTSQAAFAASSFSSWLAHCSSLQLIITTHLMLCMLPAQAARHMLGLKQVNLPGGPGKRSQRKRSRKPLLWAPGA